MSESGRASPRATEPKSRRSTRLASNLERRTAVNSATGRFRELRLPQGLPRLRTAASLSVEIIAPRVTCPVTVVVQAYLAPGMCDRHGFVASTPARSVTSLLNKEKLHG